MLDPSGLNSVPDPDHSSSRFHSGEPVVLTRPHALGQIVDVPLVSVVGRGTVVHDTDGLEATARGSRSELLLRKEVIQPHLPVRLPCYDFVPIAGPALGGCPPGGLANRLQASPTFMT